MRPSLQDIHASLALQQPQWDDARPVERVRATLRTCPPLVTADAAEGLRHLLADVAAGRALLLQAGDCAEDPAESSPRHVRRKTDLLDHLAEAAGAVTGKPVLRVGRIAGQFAKPRSKPVEQVGGITLPVFRGHMVNAPEADPVSRRADPERILTCHQAAREIVRELADLNAGRPPAEQVWTSHEALLLDYELPMLRQDGTRSYLGSTHLPWIGERTRQPDGAHVRLLAEVLNPVACKIGSGTTTEDVTALADRLDPHREPGRLVLVARMGTDFVASRLPPLVEAVRAAGHPAIWLCDPMHGNTITSPAGHKTRLVDAMLAEIEGFGTALAESGGVNGGLHLETTPDDVTECAADVSQLGSVGDRHTTFCDPRLNPDQALRMVTGWAHTLR
ncbi:phospho-2-dehydro-3-deoxyheptonate aldolase [Streptomyces griseoluteus]|uniref:Phospho-2-dehydro-3-deoxyheptonate aldolase n=1 Tax=Streptomyces griseoluteus TaxID=29306 RepID=F6KXC8_STRGP|nr:3-deoxy-7-phosphoheptulonate synthase [Streptomyces griseoluteus]AEG23589.1 putative 3-deoxy-D-arabino-heptulosonic acid 7-phosphate synthase [Streptomyces griseoluteus]TGN84585.1 phospho-2-dehydro-3-deoxyheptonate aldolase [Streptomyces griseoluteus]GHE99764.1 phospho-2-dehydro-3-deoxyheptonate aldolase [Streptomyces griseoluteus]